MLFRINNYRLYEALSCVHNTFFFLHFYRDKRTLTWENGRREGISRGRFPWSTGGSRGPQPDGGPGSENCLAILNNVYNDRVKFHDVGCSHTKPTVCEQ